MNQRPNPTLSDCSPRPLHPMIELHPTIDQRIGKNPYFLLRIAALANESNKFGSRLAKSCSLMYFDDVQGAVVFKL